MNSIKKVYRRFKSWMNYDPPGALSTKGWRLFKKEFKEQAPVRYWIMNKARYKFLMPIKWKYEGIADWVRYRTYDRHHVVYTGLEPGYNDVDTTMLHVNFNLLKEFVEVEQAWSRYCWNGEYKKGSWFEKHMPFYRIFVPFRDPALGIDHFEWAATLDDPNLPPYERSDQQAANAREILELYMWWVKLRPARKEIEYLEYDHQGLDILAPLDEDFDRNAEDFKAHEEVMAMRAKQEEEWDNEDERMLIRLIKIRRSLWT